MATKQPKPKAAPPDTDHQVLRPPAEAQYAAELQALAQADREPRPPGWKLSPRAVRAFLCGSDQPPIGRKFYGDATLVERAVIGLAGNRGLLLVGEPGTAKSMLSELLTAAISGSSTNVIQGSAGTTEDNIKYSWNYALLLADGPSERSLVPAPLYRGMRDGTVVRFEEITRCPVEIQDTLLSVLSDRVLGRIERRRQEQASELRRFLWVLGTIGSSAPFIGLFGTAVADRLLADGRRHAAGAEIKAIAGIDVADFFDGLAHDAGNVGRSLR